MTDQPREREPSWLERLAEARRLLDAARAGHRRSGTPTGTEAERRRVCAWQVSAPLWEAELARPTLTPRPPQTSPYDQETDR